MELFKYVVRSDSLGDFRVFEKYIDIKPKPIDPAEEEFNLNGAQEYTSWKELGNPPKIGRGLDLSYTSIENLGDLKHVGLFLRLNRSSISDLGNLEHVGTSLWLHNTPYLKSLGKLDFVGSHIYVSKNSSTEELVINSKFADKVIQWI